MFRRNFWEVFRGPDGVEGGATGDGTSSAPASGGTTPATTTPTTPSGDSKTFPSVKLGEKTPPADPNAAPKVGADGKPIPADPNAPAPLVGKAPEGEYAAPTLAEGQEIDADLVKGFAPLAKELGLTQAGFQKMVDWYATNVAGKENETFVNQVSQWEKDTRADKEVGGAKFDGSVENALKAVNAFGTPELTKLLTSYGLGNHPEVVRVFARIGSAIVAEDKSVGAPGSTATAKDARDLFYGPAKTT